MNAEAAVVYRRRMQRVLDHVDTHMAGTLDLDALAGVAAFSRHHFHRQFTATFGLTPHRYVQLSRMKRASFRLAFREEQPVTGIALDAGYEASDTFARAFRDRTGQSPSEFRRSPDWDAWRDAFEPHAEARSANVQQFSTNQVTIETVADEKVAVMRHRGDPRGIGRTIGTFIAWRKSAGLTPPRSGTFTVYHDDPRTTPPAAFRMDLCAGSQGPVTANEEGVVDGIIPGGRCAMLRVTGMSDNLEPAALFLYRDWLPGSGEEPRDFPLYCRRVSFFPDVAEHEAVTELYLPLK